MWQIEQTVDQPPLRVEQAEQREAKLSLVALTSECKDKNKCSERIWPVTELTAAGARDALLEALEQNVEKDKHRKRFIESAEKFEKRAVAAGLGPEEVRETYRQVARLLKPDATSAVPHNERIKIAQQVMRQAAEPTNIDQGRHNTCGLAAVEVRTYTMYPSKAAQLVADIATANKYTTADNTTLAIHPGSLKTDEESKNDPTYDGQRSHASQIFQITAANIHWLRATTNHRGQPISPGTMGVAQFNELRAPKFREGDLTFDLGERLIDFNVKPPVAVADNYSMLVGYMEDICNQISGRNESGFIIENEELGASKSIKFKDEKGLRETLATLKSDARMPAMMRVHTSNEPFYQVNGTWHFVNILDYDPVKCKALISNQWGKRSDVWIDCDDLYKASLKGNYQIPELPSFKSMNHDIVPPNDVR